MRYIPQVPTMSLCMPTLNLLNTNDIKYTHVSHYDFLTQVLEESTEQLHSFFFFFPGMNRAFNINTEMEVISIIYWILKHLRVFSQTVYLIGSTHGPLIVRKIRWHRQRNSYLASIDIFRGFELIILLLEMMLRNNNMLFLALFGLLYLIILLTLKLGALSMII